MVVVMGVGDTRFLFSDSAPLPMLNHGLVPLIFEMELVRRLSNFESSLIDCSNEVMCSSESCCSLLPDCCVVLIMRFSFSF